MSHVVGDDRGHALSSRHRVIKNCNIGMIKKQFFTDFYDFLNMKILVKFWFKFKFQNLGDFFPKTE
jgi:hypothetical protein